MEQLRTGAKNSQTVLREWKECSALAKKMNHLRKVNQSTTAGDLHPAWCPAVCPHQPHWAYARDFPKESKRANKEFGERESCTFLATKLCSKIGCVCRQQLVLMSGGKEKIQGKVGAPRRERQRSLLFLTFTDAANTGRCKRLYLGGSVQTNRQPAYTEYICKSGDGDVPSAAAPACTTRLMELTAPCLPSCFVWGLSAGCS